jgi:integrase
MSALEEWARRAPGGPRHGRARRGSRASGGAQRRRLDRLQVHDIRAWLNGIRKTCQCCSQGEDAARPPDRQRCCAIGRCCGQRLSERTIKNIRDTLRAALGNAVAEELISRNVASVVRLPVPRKRKQA